MDTPLKKVHIFKFIYYQDYDLILGGSHFRLKAYEGEGT